MSAIQTAMNWKRFVLLLGLIPLTCIGAIYIFYGKTFEALLVHINLIEFMKLSTHLSFFEPNIALPLILKMLGQLSIFSIRIIFVLWLFLDIFISYLKLSRQEGYKIELIFELIIISLVYFFIISPEKNMIVYILGYVMLAVNSLLILFYWIYQLKIDKQLKAKK